MSDFWKAMLGATVFSVLGALSLVYLDAPAVIGWFPIVFFGGGGLIVLFKEIYLRRRLKKIRQLESSVDIPTQPISERVAPNRFFAFFLKSPPKFVPTRYPLKPALKQKLQEILHDLESAGILAPREVTIDEAIEAAEFWDDFTELDFHNVAQILHSLNEKRGKPRSNVSFLYAEGDMHEAAIAGMIRELARLAGKEEAVRVLSVTSPEGGTVIPAYEEPFAPNAKVDFEVDGRRCSVLFKMLARYVPIGLQEGIAEHLLAHGSQKRFIEAYLDSFFLTALIDEAHVAVLQAKFPGEFAFLGATSQIGQVVR